MSKLTRSWPVAGRAFARASLPPKLFALLVFSFVLTGLGVFTYIQSLPGLAAESPLVRQWVGQTGGTGPFTPVALFGELGNGSAGSADQSTFMATGGPATGSADPAGALFGTGGTGFGAGGPVALTTPTGTPGYGGPVAPGAATSASKLPGKTMPLYSGSNGSHASGANSAGGSSSGSSSGSSGSGSSGSHAGSSAGSGSGSPSGGSSSSSGSGGSAGSGSSSGGNASSGNQASGDGEWSFDADEIPSDEDSTSTGPTPPENGGPVPEAMEAEIHQVLVNYVPRMQALSEKIWSRVKQYETMSMSKDHGARVQIERECRSELGQASRLSSELSREIRSVSKCTDWTIWPQSRWSTSYEKLYEALGHLDMLSQELAHTWGKNIESTDPSKNYDTWSAYLPYNSSTGNPLYWDNYILSVSELRL